MQLRIFTKVGSPLFNVCLTRIFNELMYDWRYVCVCVCMSVLCLRGGCIFCVTFPALAFSCLFKGQGRKVNYFGILVKVLTQGRNV